MSKELREARRIRNRLPDYFKALELPWHFAAHFMSKFVDDDEQPLGLPNQHARNLFHVAKALRAECVAYCSSFEVRTDETIAERAFCQYQNNPAAYAFVRVLSGEIDENVSEAFVLKVLGHAPLLNLLEKAQWRRDARIREINELKNPADRRFRDEYLCQWPEPKDALNASKLGSNQGSEAHVLRDSLTVQVGQSESRSQEPENERE